MDAAEIRVRVLEIAERSVHRPYIVGGGGSDAWRDKDLREIFDRANKMFCFVLDDSTETDKMLIEKLKGVLLCDSK